MQSSFQIIEKDKFSHKSAKGPASGYKRSRYIRGQGSGMEKRRKRGHALLKAKPALNQLLRIEERSEL
jgi:hypothetical protein